MRQALGGLLWSKQFYHEEFQTAGSKAIRRARDPPPERLNGRNREWHQLYNADVISMPGQVGVSGTAAWDLAFHCISLGQRFGLRQGAARFDDA